MKTTVIILLFLFSFSLFALSKDDVIKMAQIKLGADIIMSTVKSSNDIIKMEKEDIIDMKKAGVPDEVIKFLIVRYLESQKTQETKVEEKKETKTAEQLKQEEEEKLKKEEEEKRIREEELKKAEERIEQKKLEQLERQKGEKLLPLKNGIGLYKQQEYEKAIIKFNEFFKTDFPKDSNEYYLGLFNTGVSFSKAKNYYSAITYLKEVLIRGPEVTIEGEQKGLYFMLAFETFAEITTDWPFNSDFDDVYNLMSTYNIALLPAEFQEKFNYYMGKYFTKWAPNPVNAEKYFSKILETSTFYASTQYLWGLTDVKAKKYQSSIDHFQKAIVASQNKKNKQDDLRDLSYIALGRIYYELATMFVAGGDKDRENGIKLAQASIDSYKKVSKDSPKLATAYYESSWAAFITSDFDLSLGYLHSLHSAYLSDNYFPDKYILEAGIYVNMCLFKYAEEAVSAFKKRYDPLKKELDDFLSEPLEPNAYYGILDKIASEKPFKGKKFSYELVSYVISDGFFYENHKALKKIVDEKNTLKKWSKNGKGNIEMFNKLFEEVSKKEERLYLSTSSWIRRKLQNASNELMNLNLKADEISFEIISAEKRNLQQQKEAITTGKQTETGPVEKIETEKTYILKENEMMWKFTGEYWLDEIDNYRSFLQSKCAQ